VVVVLTVVVSYGVHRVGQPSFGSKTSAGPASTTAPGTNAPVPCTVAAGLPWQPIGPSLGGRQPAQEAVPVPTEAAVWMDKSLLTFQVIPGKQVPGGTGWKPVGAVPVGEQSKLVAAFSGGLSLRAAQGGFYAQGRAGVPLVSGRASLIIGQDGAPSVRAWDQGPVPGPDVAAVRQQLELLVDNGQVTAAANEPFASWGPLNVAAGWRSGVGVDRCGNLIWAGGANLTPATLADLLLRAGSVRAMELQIGHSQVTFNTYRASSLSIRGTRLLPTMATPADRYLAPDSWDFVAVLTR
jgi:hypothetical protein